MQQPISILLADDEEINLRLLSELCQQLGYHCHTARNGRELVDMARRELPDLIVTDVVMPELDGFAATQLLKNDPATADIPVIIVTAKDSRADRLSAIERGASDFLTKPYDIQELSLRIGNNLKIKKYQDLLKDNAALLEHQVTARTFELRTALADLDTAYHKVQTGYIDTVYRLTLAAEYKDSRTGDHIRRVSHFAKYLAAELGQPPEFTDTIFYAAPMHDVGKVGIPDAILLKPGPLTDPEWQVMKTHTVIGAEILKGSDAPVLRMAQDIARSHHERFDGSGYPAGLSGEQIPLAARVAALVDQYDAIRSARSYKGAHSHHHAHEMLVKGDGRTSPGHFDPQVLDVFRRRHKTFEEIFASASSNNGSAGQLMDHQFADMPPSVNKQ